MLYENGDMMGRFAVERVKGHGVDMMLLAVLTLLVGVGLSMLFSSSYFRAQLLFDDPLYFLRRQLLWMLLGIGCAFVATRLSPLGIERLAPPIVFVSLTLLVLTFVPGIGARYLGARRWIFLFGLSFQPSELAKLALVLYLARVLARKHERIKEPLGVLLPPLIVVGLFAVVIYLQNDFSTAMFIVLLALSMFFVADVPFRHFIGLALLTIPLGTILLLSREHRVNRILTFLFPNVDPSGAGYQALSARAALERGGLWGVGIGRSIRKLGRLPEAHSDFVLAIVAEETGFLGVFFVMLLFVAFACCGFSIAARTRNRFVSYMAFGLTASIFFQALFNMAVVSGLVPATGIPLPFFSTGGSSMLITMIMCGMLIGISRPKWNRDEAQ